jgi:GntR family transcriptional regulator
VTEAEKTGQHVARALRAEILSGELAEGSRFPSISEIQSRFNVKKSAAEHALRVLRGEGLIVTRPGAPTVVKKFERVDRDSARLKREQWGAGRAIQDRDTGDRWRTVNVEVAEGPAPDFVAEKLGVTVDQPVLIRSRAFEVDGRPVQLAVSYIPVELARGTAIAYTDTGPGGIYARLDERGFGPAEFVEEVIVRAASPEEADRLRLASGGARVFEITRAALASDGRCVEVNRMVLDVDAYRLVNHFSA